MWTNGAKNRRGESFSISDKVGLIPDRNNWTKLVILRNLYFQTVKVRNRSSPELT